MIKFVKLLNGGEVTLDSASEAHGIFQVKYHGEGAKPVQRTAWITGDGRWVTSNLVDIETRIDHLVRFGAWMDCLRSKDLRVYLDGSEAKSKEQARELGPLVQRVGVDCSGTRRKLCENLGYSTFPTMVWKGKSEVGVRKRKWIAANLACPLKLFDTIAAPPEVIPSELGRRLQRLHELAADSPVDLVNVRRDGAVWVVVLSRGRSRPQHMALRVSANGVYLLEAPIDMAKESRDVRARRGFVACLSARKARLFVNSKDKKTLRWLASIAAEARGVAIDCASPAGKPICAKSGITQFPTAERGGVKIGPKIGVTDLEALTGCKR